MKVIEHQIDSLKIAELKSEKLLIENLETGFQLLVDLYYQGFDGIIIYKENISQNYFDLKTKMLSELLQKFSNFRVKLTIIGNLDEFKSNSLNNFIFESNKSGLVNFTKNINEALENIVK